MFKYCVNLFLGFLLKVEQFSLHNKFRVGKSTVHQIIKETCKAIWEKLQPIYLPQLTRNDFERINAEFFDVWQLPNCVGAIDGRHMRIKAPPMSGNIVLLAAVDAHYKFTWVDIGQYGKCACYYWHYLKRQI